MIFQNEYLQESGADDLLLEDGSGVYLLESPETQISTADWPPLSRVRQAGSIEVTANLLLSVLAATTAAVTREPLYHALPKPPAPFAYSVPNLLTSTLAPAQAQAAAPFNVEDFGPLQPRPWRASEVQPNLLLTTLAPAASAQMPSTPLDLDAIPADTWRASFVPPNLLTSTLAATPAAAPFRPIDFPPPKQAQWRQDYSVPNLLAGGTLSLAPPAQPFAQLDWPPPLQPVRGDPWPSVFPASLALLTAPAPIVTPVIPGAGKLRFEEFAQRQLVISRKFLKRYSIEEEPSEEQFIESVTETIREAEKPAKPAAVREIGLLSALDTITRAYNVRFETIAAAKAALAAQQVALEEEDMIAVMMILAMADDP